LKYTQAIEQLNQLGDDSWAVYKEAKARAQRGVDVIELTIGEPDVPTPNYLVDTAIDALRAGRTNYSAAAGEINLRQGLATRYSKMSGRDIDAEQILCFPGTQTALYAVMNAIAERGDQVIVGDPMYATYDAVISSASADIVSVPLKAENGFRMQADDVKQLISEATSVLFLNTPHNPTGSVLSKSDILRLCELAKENDLWILCDEVYDEMLFDDGQFCSPLEFAEYADRTIVVSSISKSHAAPGFRSGWCVASHEFCERVLPFSEAMLFGSQPFLADATAVAIAKPSPVAVQMKKRFAARAAKLATALHQHTSLEVHQPSAGMFALVNVSTTNMNGKDYAWHLLENAKVGVMPGASFGNRLNDWVRVSLTQADDVFDQGIERMIEHAKQLSS